MAIRSSDIRLLAGTQTVVTVSAASPITSFPMQSDQVYALKWRVPESTHPTRPIREGYQDFSLREHGYYSWTWDWGYLTFGQLSYLITTFYGGDKTLQYANVTVKEYDELNVAQYLTCVMSKPVLSKSPETSPAGWDVMTTFTKGVIIT